MCLLVVTKGLCCFSTFVVILFCCNNIFSQRGNQMVRLYHVVYHLKREVRLVIFVLSQFPEL